ncbi:hypothetical protein SPAR10_1483 [Streptococcus infantis SPAR10]|uniref:Uncharacterized protein n=1 Tax=Streptococcus infantis SPAR10 TaxID=1159208 RepID=J0YNV5_9STRE|nr:hypothetical protein SPAR10_1483 [Streptococcus infantis SPAR10]
MEFSKNFYNRNIILLFGGIEKSLPNLFSEIDKKKARNL